MVHNLGSKYQHSESRRDDILDSKRQLHNGLSPIGTAFQIAMAENTLLFEKPFNSLPPRKVTPVLFSNALRVLNVLSIPVIMLYACGSEDSFLF